MSEGQHKFDFFPVADCVILLHTRRKPSTQPEEPRRAFESPKTMKVAQDGRIHEDSHSSKLWWDGGVPYLETCPVRVHTVNSEVTDTPTLTR